MAAIAQPVNEKITVEGKNPFEPMLFGRRHQRRSGQVHRQDAVFPHQFMGSFGRGVLDWQQLVNTTKHQPPKFVLTGPSNANSQQIQSFGKGGPGSKHRSGQVRECFRTPVMIGVVCIHIGNERVGFERRILTSRKGGLQDELAQILVLHDLGQSRPHIVPIDHDARPPHGRRVE
jgi:hypothetical protein